MNTTKIPASLKERPQWVMWKTIEREGQATKLPFQVNGIAAKSNDAATWNTFEAVCECLPSGEFDGVGFVFSESDEFCGIDLDGCRNPETGEIAEWARELVRLFDSYTEVSPSQTGVKIFILGKSPFERGRKQPVSQPKVSDKEPAIEIYDHKRYFAVTGKRLGGVSGDVQARQEELDALCRQAFPERKAPTATARMPDSVGVRATKYLQRMPVAISGMGGHNATFRAACVLVLGFGLTVEEAYPILADWNQGCEPPWSERELRHKLEDASRAEGERNYLRDAKPEEYAKIKLPEHAPPKPGPAVTTLADAARSYIEVVKSGKSSLVSLGLPDIDYALGGGVERGEMVILAARPSHGKSAVALQCIHGATASGKPSIMVSEEMSSLALGKRAVQFATDIPQEHWRHDGKVLNDIEDHFDGRATCIVVESCRTAERAANEIRKAVEQHGVTFAVVDYAQLLQSKGNSRYEQITNTSITLRQVATECKVVLLVLCQLSRSIESRSAFLPMMSDLKDSGQIEQDADVIMFLCWPHRLDRTKPIGEYLFFIGKNRNREIVQGTVKVRFDPGRQMFMSERSHFDGPVDPFEERGNGFGEPWTG